MKRIISYIMTAALCVFILTACGNGNGQNKTSQNKQETKAAIQQETKAAIQQETKNTAKQENQNATEQKTYNSAGQTGKVLVVYYSATGNTKAVADIIADYTGGDTFELVPVDKYSNDDLDWTKKGSRVNLEHENKSLQDIKLVSTNVDNFDSYDRVFIGYPIWWHEAAWPVNNFVKNNDFSGKTVIPFCTSTSSGLEESGVNLAAMAGTGNWQSGQRFGERAGKDEVRKWLSELGF